MPKPVIDPSAQRAAGSAIQVQRPVTAAAAVEAEATSRSMDEAMQPASHKKGKSIDARALLGGETIVPIAAQDMPRRSARKSPPFYTSSSHSDLRRRCRTT